MKTQTLCTTLMLIAEVVAANLGNCARIMPNIREAVQEADLVIAKNPKRLLFGKKSKAT